VSADEPRPTFGRSLGLFWLYTLLRFGLFGAIWALLWLVGVGWLIAAAIAVFLSIPLSWVLLARPRQAFAANIEQRVNARVERRADFDARLAADDDDQPEQPEH
jgi:O-antigen ligase